MPDDPTTGPEDEVLVGPVLRYLDTTGTATVFLETARPCTVRIETSDGGSTEQPTWSVHGHHYVLVTLRNLPTDTAVTYEVFLDDERVWPLADSPYPPSEIHPAPADRRLRLAFGSCRELGPYDDEGLTKWGPDALVALADRVLKHPPDQRPDLILHLGDQVYADEPAPEMVDRLRELHADEPDEDVREEIRNFEEYTWLYQTTWMHPAVRWLLSTVANAMILDDHDLRDDWNTSISWRREMEAQPWWKDRAVGGLGTYWVYQHIGNLSPDELTDDELFTRVTGSDEATATAALDAFAWRADQDPDSTRWSYTRSLGPARLVVIDTRCSRTLDPPEDRAIVDAAEWQWLREKTLSEPVPEHVLIASTLPAFLPYGVHHVEGWSEAIATGAWGWFGKRWGEKIRQGLDLEHWPAYRNSFDGLVDLLGELVDRPEPPKSVLILSGDIHFSYTSRVHLRAHEGHATPVHQLVQSPLRNTLPRGSTLMFRFFHHRMASFLLRPLARTSGVGDPNVNWEFESPLSFKNGLMSVELDGPEARVAVDEAHMSADGREILVRTHVRPLTDPAS